MTRRISTLVFLGVAIVACGEKPAKTKNLEADASNAGLNHFQTADANGDGVLDTDEFKILIDLQAAENIGRAPQIKRFGAHDRAFKTLDANGDGKVTLDEINAFQAR